MDGSEQLRIERVFNASKEAVWNAWTKPELIKLWWGPEGFSAPQIEIDLREGGTYHYCMHGKPTPDAKEEFDMWSAGTFKEVVPMEKIVATDYFSNEKGDKLTPKDFGLDENFPDELSITILFEEIEDQKTKLSIIYPKPESEAAVKAMMASGMNEGWQSSLNKLAKVVEKT